MIDCLPAIQRTHLDWDSFVWLAILFSYREYGVVLKLSRLNMYLSYREYSTALRCELLRKSVRDEERDRIRDAELAAYFTHFKLQPVHRCLALRSAMTTFFKLRNFNTTAEFCRRMLELNPPAKVQTSAPSFYVLFFAFSGRLVRDENTSFQIDQNIGQAGNSDIAPFLM